ncbi:hypothetical protein JJB99_31080 [Bradyrhizobium diazoefficiens]|uniref:hypothetical protein n=1 Tax=Bradyrhizobium diazoefficiens TaxID=1355477 RepID=UPI00190B6743|nr:hypothetical protein [Bradyrhizobium diazoefficiens]QQO13780.1 hypothetical protein JJB99_31080 [Bradyrhizobium diazoefficiens]
MTNVIDEPSSLEPPPVLHRSSRRFASFFALAAVSIGLCAGAAYFWTNAEEIFEKPSVGEVAPTTSLSPEDREALLEIRSEQQKASDQIGEINRNIGTQQDDLKRMADQIEALTSRIESLQKPTVPSSVLLAPSQPPAPPVSRPGKRAVQPAKPEGPVSVGGAPLISEPSTSQR